MPTETLPIPVPLTCQAAKAVPLSPAEKLLVNMTELAQLTSLSVRHLRRLDSSRDIPGRVVVGRRVLFQTEIIVEWVRAGLAGREQWPAFMKKNGMR